MLIFGSVSQTIAQTQTELDSIAELEKEISLLEAAYQANVQEQIEKSTWGEWFQTVYYGNTVQFWIISLLFMLGAVVVGKVTYWLIGKFIKALTKKTKTKLDDLLVDKLEEPFVFAMVITGIWWGFERLNFKPGLDEFLDHTFMIVYVLNITWMIARTLDAIIEEYLVPITEKSESDLDDQLLPIVRKGLRSVIWALGIIVGLNNAGFDVAALIAGLGIGGLALAMAAKDSVSNIFGGITIFVDKPFQVGDRVVFQGFDGTIIEVGLRVSRLQTLEGRIVTIPNSLFNANIVENVSREPSRKIVLNLGLTYDTAPAEIDKALNILKEIGDKRADTEEDVLVSFNAWGDFALGLLFIYYIKKGEDILQTQTEINLEILERFNGEGLEFAFPTQTILHQKLPDAAVN